MLRRIELEVLANVDRGDTISELAAKLAHSESYLNSSENRRECRSEDQHLGEYTEEKEHD